MSPMPRCIHCARGPWVNDDGTGIRTYHLVATAEIFARTMYAGVAQFTARRNNDVPERQSQRSEWTQRLGGPSKTASPSI